MPVTLQLSVPYLVFLGDVPSKVYAKTALGLAQWAPELCVAQHRFPNCEIDTGLPDMSIAEAAQAGVKSLLIGSAPVGGAIQDNWIPSLLRLLLRAWILSVGYIPNSVITLSCLRRGRCGWFFG